jgi:hypothetical protein
VTTVAVPVRTGPGGTQTLRLVRLPDGTRVGLAFSSSERAREVLGPDCALTALSLTTLRHLLAPLGVTRVQVDPTTLLAPAPLRVVAS